VVLMPSFVNLGAYVDTGTMVDTWATVGSCAQIGKNVHLSGGVGIGGVLEPLQAGPTIIEDNCFIGARSEVVEGVIVGEGAVLAMGVFIGASTKIVDRATGEIHRLPDGAALFRRGLRLRLPGKPLPDGGSAGPASSFSHSTAPSSSSGRRADPLQDRHQRTAARDPAGAMVSHRRLPRHGRHRLAELRADRQALAGSRPAAMGRRRL
jgi:hypothetical protein